MSPFSENVPFSQMQRPATAPVRTPPVKPIRRLKGYPPTPISTPERQLAYRSRRTVVFAFASLTVPARSARNRDFKGCKAAIEQGADVNHYEVPPSA